MKLANISLSVLALAFAAAPAFSADLTVQGELIGSQSKLEIGKVTSADGITKKTDGKADTVGAAGAGVSLQYKLNDAVRLGGGFSYANFDGDKAEYSDMALSANSSYDFYKQEAFALYALGGLSYHMVDPANETVDDKTYKMKTANLLNYDLGVGGRFDLAENVNLSLSYRFSDTLAKGSFDSTAAVAGAEAEKFKSKDVSLQKNDFIASVGYSF